jgi:hypothetical protein
MSIPHEHQIQCPSCGASNNFIIWETLNGDLDPKAKQDLLDGTLFTMTCSDCGEKTNISYEILYHDMKNHTMVFCVEPNHIKVVQEEMELMKQLHSQPGGATPQIKTRNRIVTSTNRLREKAIIFDANLDDRVIEIIKLLCWAEIKKTVDDVNEDELYFFIDNGKYQVIEPSRGIVCDIPLAMYDSNKMCFQPMLDLIGDDEYIIDHNFAGMLIMSFNSMRSDTDNR